MIEMSHQEIGEVGEVCQEGVEKQQCHKVGVGGRLFDCFPAARHLWQLHHILNQVDCVLSPVEGLL